MRLLSCQQVRYEGKGRISSLRREPSSLVVNVHFNLRSILYGDSIVLQRVLKTE
jgi:hypothetical protein